jgi:hypothetical protein
MSESARDEALTDEQILRCFDGTHFQMSNAECIAAGRRLIALARQRPGWVLPQHICAAAPKPEEGK